MKRILTVMSACLLLFAFCEIASAQNAYASIYVADGSTLQALTSTPAKMVGFATEGSASDDVQGNASVVPVVASDKIEVKQGSYLCIFSCSGDSATADETVQAVLRQEAAEIASGQSISEAETADEPFTLGFTTVIEVTAAQELAGGGSVSLEIYLESSANLNFTPVHANLTVVRLY